MSNGINDRNPLAVRWLACLVFTMLVAGCSVPGPEVPAGTFGLDFSMPPGSVTQGAIVFVIDGVAANTFEEMLRNGELPNIQKYIIDRGVYAPRTVANIPSITLPNLTAIATGRFPGHHGVICNNWFDRNAMFWRNYDTIAQKNTLDGDCDVPNIYESFPDQTTVSVFFQPHRNATKFIEDWSSAGPPFFFGWYEFVDRLTLYRLHLVTDIARRQGRFPAVTVVYLLSPDFLAYGYGANSPQYRQALRHSDRQIGRVLADLERAGLLNKVHLALVSDHGHIEVTSHWPLVPFLRTNLGLDIPEHPAGENIPFEDRLEAYDKASCVATGSGDRFWALSLRKPLRRDGQFAGWDSWLTRPDENDLRHYPVRPKGQHRSLKAQPSTALAVDLLKTLAGEPAIDVMAYSPGKGAVRVIQGSSELEFQQQSAGEPITCRRISGDDPLGWKAHLPDEAFHGMAYTPRQWLAMTHRSDYPDLPAQILAYFRNRRAGDIALFAKPGMDFSQGLKSGHGGLRPGDMFVPMAIAGPGLSPRRVDIARSADLMPTLLDLLGRPIPPGLDGQSLLRGGGQ